MNYISMRKIRSTIKRFVEIGIMSFVMSFGLNIFHLHFYI